MIRNAVLGFCLLCVCALPPAWAGDRGGRGLTIDPDGFARMPRNDTAAPEGARGLAPEGPLPEGPLIVLRQPDDGTVFAEGESIAVHLEFLPAADGAAPDMATLSVSVRKGWFGKDITDVLEPYVEGAAIRVPEVDFAGHTGEFEFEVGIGDDRGRSAEATFLVTVES